MAMSPERGREAINLVNYPELIPPQVGMTRAAQDARAQGFTKGYIDSATGTGKTYAAAHDVKNFIEEENNPGAKVLYLCHNNDILDQALETFQDVHPDSDFGNIREGVFETDAQFTFATFQSLTSVDRVTGESKFKQLDPESYQHIIVDESHHGPAETYSGVIKHFNPDFLLGLTATSEREDGKQLEDIFERKIFDYRLEQGIAEGVLAHPDYRLYTEQSKGLTKLIKEVGSLTLRDIKKQVELIKRTPEAKQEVARTIIEAQEEVENPMTIVYCSSIDEAEEYSDLLPDSLSLHSKLHPDDQKEILSWYREGQVPTLAVVGKLDEGVDVPETNILAFIGATESKVKWLQRLGRGLRNYPGKKSVIVLDFAASWERINQVADLKDKVETIYTQPKSRPNKSNGEYQPSGDIKTLEEAPFTFSFSKDTLDAISVVQRMRNNGKAKRAKASKGSRVKKWDEEEKAVMEMFSLDKLPNQRISDPEWKEFEQRLAKGDLSVKDAILVRRLRDTMSHAKSALKKLPEGTSLTIEDCFQNAIQEMSIAIDKFNSGKDISLKQALSMAAFRSRRLNTSDGNIIRVPENVQTSLNKTTDHQDPEDTFSDAERVKNIGEYQRYDDIVTQGQGTVDIVREVSHLEQREALKKSLEHLSYRDRRVLQLRWGLDGEKPETLDQVGRRFNLTRTRIMQIENQSIKKIQNQDEAQSLRDFAGTDETGDHLGKLPISSSHRRRQIQSIQRRIEGLIQEQRTIRTKATMHDDKDKQKLRTNEDEVARLGGILAGLLPDKERLTRLKVDQTKKEDAVRKSQVLFAHKQNDTKRLAELGYDVTVKKSGLTVFQEVMNEAVSEISRGKKMLGQSDQDYFYEKVNKFALKPSHIKRKSLDIPERRREKRLLTLQAVRDGSMDWLNQFGYDTNKVQTVVQEAVAEHRQHRLTMPVEDYIYLRLNQKARKS